jgi:hypothetical protein
MSSTGYRMTEWQKGVSYLPLEDDNTCVIPRTGILDTSVCWAEMYTGAIG